MGTLFLSTLSHLVILTALVILEPVNKFLHQVFVSLVSLADLEAFDDDTSSLARLSSSLLWVADFDVRAEEVFESLR